MAASIQFRGCTIDGKLAQAVLGVRETLADHLTNIEAKVAAVKPSLDAIVAGPVTDFRVAANDVFRQSTVGSQAGFLAKIAVPAAPAGVTAIERALVPYGVVIINGKIVPLAKGDTLDRIRGLYNRLDNDLATTKSLLRAKSVGDFILVVRYFDETEVVTADNCGDNIATVTQDKLGGVDIAPIDVALQNKVPVANVRSHIFWLGRVGPTRPNLLRLQRFGYSETEIRSIFSVTSSGTIAVSVIDDKTLLDRLASSPSTQLTDADLTELLARADVLNVSTTFDTGDVTKAMRDAMRRRPPTRNSDGFRNHQSPAVLLAQTIDIRRSFNVDDALAQIPPTAGQAAIATVIDSFVDGAQRGLVAVATTADSLNQVFEMVAVADNLFDISPIDVLLCLLGLDLAFSISLDFLINLILAALDAFRLIIALIIAMLTALVDMFCFILSVLNGILAIIGDLLACLGLSVPQLDIPDFLRAIIQAIIDALQAVQQVVEEIVALIISFLSFSFALASSLGAKKNQQVTSCMANSGILLRVALISL
jgi:hypothetical protein